MSLRRTQSTLSYPRLLDYPEPHLKAYNRETAIAEKFEAMDETRRIKQPHERFLRHLSLSGNQSFDGVILSKAVANTFEAVTHSKIRCGVLFRELRNSPDKQKQWQAFVKRTQHTGQIPETFDKVGAW
jgi:hypothetical protein